MKVKEQQSELDMEQWTGSKLGKEYIKAYIYLAYLTYMRIPACRMPCWMKHKLKLRLQGEISITSGMQGFPGGSEVKASAWNSGDPGLIPGSGRSLGEGNGNPLQYSCLENPIEGGA